LEIEEHSGLSRVYKKTRRGEEGKMKSRDELIEELGQLSERLNNRMWVWRPIQAAITQLKADAQEIENLRRERRSFEGEADTLKAENERLRSLAYDDGDTHFSWKELAQQLQKQNAELREGLREAKELCKQGTCDEIANGTIGKVFKHLVGLTPQPKKEECK